MIGAVADSVQVALVTAGGLVIVAALSFAGLLVTNRTVKAVKAEVADVHNTVKDVKKDTHTIDLAVNNAEIGMPTVAQRVIDQDKRYLIDAADLAAFREWHTTVLQLITDKLDVPAPPPPPIVERLLIPVPAGPDEITVERLTNAEAVADQEPA